ncbi:MAG TPA: plasmid replication protein, CyRepA1 family [Nodularia sp. (in: cyanobacteria)]|nr:plasmid replication protein, CyRepA1 family [Nodularia sp. (in: cyanobacteria)]
MTKLPPTSKNKPCLSCGDETGRCRPHSDGDINLCMAASGGRKGDIVANGYKIIGFTKCGLWAILKLDNSQEWSEERRQEWKQQQQARLEVSRKVEREKLLELLPISDRDTQYRRIVAGLGLNQKHRFSELSERRGLNTEEIDYAISQGWLCSWQRGKEVAGVSPNLAGINPKSINRTLLGVDGIGITALNASGKITGFQIASDNRDECAKYIWLSSAKYSGNSPHLPSGELPIFTWRHPEAEEITETWLVEGGLKPLITALKLWFRHGRKDIQVIGAAGGNFVGSIGAVVESLQGKVKLFPDAGSLQNSHILNQYRKILEELVTKDYSVSVAWWGQTTKTHKDIDELDDYSQLQFISIAEFQALIAENKNKQNNQLKFISTTDSKDLVDEDKQDKQKYIDDINYKRWLNSRLFKPIKKLDQAEFSFPDIPTSNAIIAIQSGLSTGKTEATLREIARTAKNKGIRLIGYRNSLLFQTIERGKNDFGLKITHINREGVALEDEAIHMSCCVNSLHKLAGLFEGHDIYIDEAVSVLLHLIDGGTFDLAAQSKAMKMFEEAVSKANRVFLLDGNLTDDVVNFIASLAPDKKLVKIQNIRKIPPHKIYFCDGVTVTGEGEERTVELKPNAKSHLVAKLIEPEVVPFIVTDSRRLAHELEKLMIDNGKTGGIVISQNTVGEPWAKKFIEDPDLYIKTHRPAFVAVTPTCESGLSIKIADYFTHKFSFFCGVLGTSSQHQIMFRLRDNTIPHYVYCPRRTQLRDNTIPRQYTAQGMIDSLYEREAQSALMGIDPANNLNVAIEIITKALIERFKNDKWVNLAAKFWALAEYEKDNLRKCLIHSLKEAGHDVSEIQMEISSDINDQMKEIKAELIEAEAEALYKAIPYGDVEEAKKEAKTDHDYAKSIKIKKTLMVLDRLPGIEQKEGYCIDFWRNHVKDRNSITRHQNFAILQDIAYSQKRHEANWYFAATAEDIFLLGMRGVFHPKLIKFAELNVLDLVNLDKEYCKESPEVISLIETFRNNKVLRTVTGITPPRETSTGKEKIEFFKSILAQIGIKFAKAKKKLHKESGKRLNFWKIDSEHFNDPLRLAIIDITKAKNSEWLDSDKAKIDWNYGYSVDDLANELAERYRTATQYSDYLAAKSEWEAKKDNSDMLTESVVQENTRIDRIIQLAWDKLTPQDQRRIVNLQPVNANYLDVLDSRVMSNNYSPEHYNALPAGTRWKLRLTEVFSMGETTAKLVYQQVPGELLQDVWDSLSDEIQQRYFGLFPQTQPQPQPQLQLQVTVEVEPEPQPQLQVAVEVEPEPQIQTQPQLQPSRFIREPNAFWVNLRQEDNLETTIIERLRQNPDDITGIGKLLYDGGIVLIGRLKKMHKDGLIKAHELAEIHSIKHKFMVANGC